MGVKRETLAHGDVLRQLVANCCSNNTQENLRGVLRCLRDSYVWIPCNPDPDVLKNEQGSFVPVFSNGDLMSEEYRSHFTLVERHFIEAMNLAEDMDVIGIVLDPFTQPFVVEKGIFAYVRELPTNIDD